MRVLTALLACAVLCTACAAPAAFHEDGWSIERRFDGGKPVVLSTSEINAGTPPALQAFQATPVRSKTRGRLRVAIAAEQAIATQWTKGAVLFDPDLDRTLDWLASLGASEARGIELRLTLMPEHGARQHTARHPAGSALVIDLLVPVPDTPRSRGAAMEAALATGLHEASHVLRPANAKDRQDDEYRASLVAACFRIDGARRGDRLAFLSSDNPSRQDFVRTHSADAGKAVNRDLAAALGTRTTDGLERDAISRLRAFCTKRLAQQAR